MAQRNERSDHELTNYPNLVTTQLQAAQCGHHIKSRYLPDSILHEINRLQGLQVMEGVGYRFQQVERQVENSDGNFSLERGGGMPNRT